MKHAQLTSQIPVAGFEWLTGPFVSLPDRKPVKEPVLVAQGGEWRTRELPDELFLEFSSLDPDSDSEILRFANLYGLLGDGPWLCLLPDADQAPKPGAHAELSIAGEPRSHWRDHVRQLKQATELWMAIQNDDKDLLAKRIQWRGPNFVTYEGPPRVAPSGRMFADFATIASAPKRGELFSYRPELFKRLRPDDLVTPAKIHLLEMVAERLKPHVQFDLRWTDDFKSITDSNQPTCLAGALYFQLKIAMRDSSSFGSCASCGKPLIIQPGGYRVNRRTCSNPCRQRLSDSRKRDARELHQAGISEKEIARRLETTREQISLWIKTATPARNRASRGSALRGKR
jgi:hypothetical protein